MTHVSMRGHDGGRGHKRQDSFGFEWDIRSYTIKLRKKRTRSLLNNISKFFRTFSGVPSSYIL